ncbi:MAG: hypothetical protein LBP58_02625 [Azoarcus sp.]|nr:hypothetical protein [Azoarcus sp.]
MTHRTWLPGTEDGLVTLMAAWKTRLTDTAAQTAYGWVAQDCTATNTTLTAFITARTTYQSTRTKANHDMKEEARKTAIAAMRNFANRYIRYNAKMNTAQKEELGIFPRDTVPSPVPVPEKGPASRVETRGELPGEVKVYTTEAKPYGTVSIEGAFGVLEARAQDPEELPHRSVFTHSPWIYQCAPDEHGKTFYYALRWVTNEGASPWSPVSAGVIIP